MIIKQTDNFLSHFQNVLSKLYFVNIENYILFDITNYRIKY
jgi:hypothetical protein